MDLNRSPYYDDYDSSKNYTEILAVPGRVAQAREFTQMQTMLKDQIARLGNAVFANGTIVSGCSLSIDGQVVTIGEGKIYLDGAVRNVEETTVEINGEGIEYIGAKITAMIITEDTDASLKDPVRDNENYGKPGAHRLKETVSFVVYQADNVANMNAAKVFTLTDGAILANNTTPTVTSVSESNEDLYTILARRTYDENGSYKINGLVITDRNEAFDEVDEDGNNGIAVTVTPGKAYVNGYEVNKIANKTLKIPFENSVRTRLNEQIKGFVAGTTVYNLNQSPARELLRATSLVSRTLQVTRGSSHGGTDNLLASVTSTGWYSHDDAISRVLSVTAGSDTYIENSDFTVDGDTIKWDLDGQEPEQGSTYTVECYVNRDMQVGTDIRLVNGFNSETGLYESKVEFLNSTHYPVIGSRTYVDYTVFLARADVIALSQDGEFKILKGTPTTLSKVAPVTNSDITTMDLGTVVVMPGYASATVDEHLRNIYITNKNLTRLSQANLFSMKERLDNLEYNQAMTDLDKEAVEGEQATMLRGILTDGFIGFTKSDTTHRDFDCGIDVENGEMSVAMVSHEYTLNPNLTNSTIGTLGGSFLAPYTEEVALSQLQATQSFKVNPYSAYDPMSLLEVFPAIDNWIDEETVFVQGATVNQSASLHRWWYHKADANGNYWGGDRWVNVEEEKALWIAMTGHDGSKLGWANYSGSSTTATTDYLYDGLITYMRQIELTVTGSNYRANAANLVCYFDDKPVSLTPLSGTSAGSNVTINGVSYRTVNANASGEFSAKFTIPANTPCGSVSVVVKNNLDKGGDATFVAQGHKQIKRVTTQTVKVNVRAIDPLAQSFQFDNDTILTKVGLFFSLKDSSKNVLLQIRNMVNGYPGTDVYDEVVIKAANVKVSNSGTSETVVNLNRPVYCQADTQYCFVILSDSNQYEMWVANIGDKNISTNVTVGSQPYGAGLMFSSSNAMTWTEHQTMDLKFKLYRAKFTGKGTVNFNKVTTADTNRVLLAAQSEDFKNDGITWYYRTATNGISNGEWIPIETYNDHELDKVYNEIEIKAELNATAGSYTSPILNNQAIDLISLINKTSGTYISRAVVMENAFNTIAVNFEAAIPQNTSYEVFYSTDNTNWNELPMSTEPEYAPKQVNEEFWKYYYKETLTVPANTYRIKIVLNSTDVNARPRIRRLMNVLRNE